MTASLEDALLNLERQIAVGESRTQDTKARLATIDSQTQPLTEEIGCLREAQGILQQLTDTLSIQSIGEITKAVNEALTYIFFDQDLRFRVSSAVKRGKVQYELLVDDRGREGNIHAYGGGIYAIIATVLKMSLNVVTKRAPVILLDESLSFVSDRYIDRTSEFLNEISENLGLSAILVTHQEKFKHGLQSSINIKSLVTETSYAQA